MENPFVKKQLDDRLEAEQDLIVMYAESCYLSIRVLSGDLSEVDRLEQLTEALTRLGRRIGDIDAALRRLDTPAGDIRHLDEQQQLDLFTAHFADLQVPGSDLDGRFASEDLREMLSELYAFL
ncbi:MAG TPA: hypothetical protein ENK49_05000 [Gammaproteobacteria bacterium]|nr:hypothetical protein [Gammaproteobacteria bacterium]